MASRVVEAIMSPAVLLYIWLDYIGVSLEFAASIAASLFIFGLIVIAVLIVCLLFGATPIFWMIILAVALIVFVAFFHYRIVKYLRGC